MSPAAPRPQVFREVGDDSDAIAEDARGEGARARVDARREVQIAELLRRSRESWLSLRIGETSISDIPQGAHAVLDGPTGAGKTACALEMARQHALKLGPAIYLSLELDAATVR